MITALRRWWSHSRWDLTALLNAASAQAGRPERHLWLIRLAEWLRSPVSETSASQERGGSAGATPVHEENGATPWPVRRLRHMLNVLERHPEHAARVRSLLHSVLSESDASALLADFGFAPRAGFASELSERLRLACLPGTPDTEDLGQLFQMVLRDAGDADWLNRIDTGTWQRLAQLLIDDDLAARWREALLDAIQLLASQVRAAAMGPSLRLRMDPATQVSRPYHQLVNASIALPELAAQPDPTALLQQVQYLRALADACRQAAASVREHLDVYGISVDVVFQVDQLRQRTERIDALLTCLVSPEPARTWPWLLAQLAQAAQERRGLGALFSHHYSMLARKVAERSAETGEHYITRTAAEYRDMLLRAGGGGLVIVGTTLMKFLLMGLGLSAFWGGFWAGINYAGSFVLIHLLHWTVATKQPAMTAPAMAAKLEGVTVSDAALQSFVDEVAHLIRSQIAGIVGNLAVVIPGVLAMQGLAWWLAGAPVVSEHDALYVLKSLTLLGPTLAFAAFTGVLLFASSLIAGWWENWFVFHRLDSAIAWNPRIVRLLGAGRAQRWSRWCRANISGLAANISLGLLLGLVPALAGFFGLPIEVRHVTLSTGQIAAALGTLGTGLLREPAFWWCVAAIPFTGALNLLVSFALAFKVALRSRGLRVKERDQLYAALRQRLREAPMSFLRPPAA